MAMLNDEVLSGDLPTVLDPAKQLKRQVETRILCLLKVGKRRHMEQLADGVLYCRKLSYYTKIEGNRQVWQDSHEGLAGIYQSNRIKIRLQPRSGSEIILSTETGLTGQIVVAANLDFHVFCLHAIHTAEWTREFGEDELEDFKKFLSVPERMAEFGDHVWIITDPSKFRSQLTAACKAKNITIGHGLVQYLDPANSHGNVPRDLVGFVKMTEFSPEREFRFTFQSADPLDDPLLLDLGSLRDASMVVSLEDFRKGFQITFPDQ